MADERVAKEMVQERCASLQQVGPPEQHEPVTKQKPEILSRHVKSPAQGGHTSHA